VLKILRHALDRQGFLGERLVPDLKEAARHLGRSDWGMRELMWAGEIPFVRTEGGRKNLF